MKLLSFFTGEVTLCGDARCASEVLDLCMRFGIVYGAFGVSDDGCFTMTLSYRAATDLVGIARRCGITLAVVRRRGILEVFRFCLSRPGIPIGVVLMTILLTVASTHLWEIDVIGNATLSRGEVAAELRAAGLEIGMPMRGLDVDSIENRLLMRSERVSWISINLIGTVAEVQIREKAVAQPPVSTVPANLVARCDGVVTSCEVLSGNLLTAVGRAVRKGEVLVSGLYDSNVMGYRYTRARGAIYAETEHTFEIEVPYAYETVEYHAVMGEEHRLLFFGEVYPLFSRGEPTAENTVERISYLSVFGKQLPIGLSVKRSYEAEAVTGQYSAERAMEIAYFRLSREIAALPEMQGILEKELTGEVGEESYLLRCRVRCIENIAETREISIRLFE